MKSAWSRTATALGVALIAGLLAGLAVPFSLWAVDRGSLDGLAADWRAALVLSAFFAAYNFVFGLLPGLAAHVVLLWMRRTKLSVYLVASLVIGGFWCVALKLEATLQAYVLVCAVVGTTAFWVIRRPDRVFVDAVV